MKMTVSVNNNSGVPYVQYGTDRQKNKAKKFANAGSKDITNLAYNIDERKHSSVKFAKGVAKAIAAVPLIAGAVVAGTTKGKVSAKTLAAGKAFLASSIGIATPLAVVDINNKIAAKKAGVRKAENKHPLLTLAGLTAIAGGALTAISVGAKKISPKATENLVKLGKRIHLDSLARKMDSAPEAIKGLATKVSEKISLPKGVKDNLSKISSKIKMPQILKDEYTKVANAETTKTAIAGMKKVGGALLRNPATSALALIGAVVIGHAVKKSVEVSQTKSKLKEAQLKTANSLVNAYAAENESLKTANSVAAARLEKASNIVAEDNVENKADEAANKAEEE